MNDNESKCYEVCSWLVKAIDKKMKRKYKIGLEGPGFGLLESGQTLVFKILDWWWSNRCGGHDIEDLCHSPQVLDVMYS